MPPERLNLLTKEWPIFVIEPHSVESARMYQRRLSVLTIASYAQQPLVCRSRARCAAYSAAIFAARASAIACQILFGVAGISMWPMPSGRSASSIALITAGGAPVAAGWRAGGAPVAPASPAPLIPSGLVVDGTSAISERRSGKSEARGIA